MPVAKKGRVIDVSVARVACQRIIAELAQVSDERSQQKVYIERLNAAIRCSPAGIEDDELCRIRDYAMKQLTELETRIAALLKACDI